MSFDKDVLGFEAAELEQLQKGLENLLNDGIESDEEKPIDEADTRATIGPYSFELPRDQYLSWIEGMKQEVGFDKEAIVNEIKNRLGLECCLQIQEIGIRGCFLLLAMHD